MNWKSHYKKLENLYLSAPLQAYYKNTEICISKNSAIITMPMRKEFFHAAQAMHGAVYFRMLDDAAYFAVSSRVADVFIVTSSFQTQLYRPVNKGILKAEGEITAMGKQLFHAEARLYNEKGDLIALGTGSFAKSSIRLEDMESYKTEVAP